MVEINWNPSKRELRQFAGAWFPGFFILVGAMAWYRTGSLPVAAVIWSVAFVVSLVGYVAPAFMRAIWIGWMCAAFPIGWTISHLMLAIVFYLVITPFGFLLRWFGGDAMQRLFDRGAKSYWVPRKPGGNTARYFKQF